VDRRRRRALPHAAELLRLLPERADQLQFHTLFWAVSTGAVTEVLTAIRATAKTRLAALPEPRPAAPAQPALFTRPPRLGREGRSYTGATAS
jgi:hypothetical protein